MKKLLILTSLLALCAVAGCATAEKTAYQTIGATETAVLSANGAYLDAVVSGQAPTNSVPQVEAEFNATQLALHTAAVLASGGTNAPVPAAVAVKANNFITLTTTAKAK